MNLATNCIEFCYLAPNNRSSRRVVRKYSRYLFILKKVGVVVILNSLKCTIRQPRKLPVSDDDFRQFWAVQDKTTPQTKYTIFQTSSHATTQASQTIGTYAIARKYQML